MKKRLSSTKFLTYEIFGLGVAIVLPGIFIDSLFQKEGTDLGTSVFILVIMLISFSMWTIGGMFMVLRREIYRPRPSNITGLGAVFGGVFVALCCFTAIILLVLELIRIL